MKKTFLFCLMIISATITMAQVEDTQHVSPHKVVVNGELKCDSIIEYNADGIVTMKQIMKYDNAGRTIFLESYTRGSYNEMNGSLKFERAYNDEGKLTKEIYFGWGEDKWQNFSKTEYTYNSNSSTTIIISEWENSQWVSKQKYLNTYNAQDMKTEEMAYKWEEGTWKNNYKFIYDYDANGNMTLYEPNRWENGQWIGTEEKKEYAYTKDNKQTLNATYRWNDGWSLRKKMVIDYNSDGNPLREEVNTYEDYGGVQADITTYGYNIEGLMTLIYKEISLSYEGNTDQREYYKAELIYDDNNNLKKKEEYYNSTNTWVLSQTTEYEYDENNNMTQELLYKHYGTETSKDSKKVYGYDNRNRMTFSGEYTWKNEEWMQGTILNYAFDDEDRTTMESRLYYFEGFFYQGYKWEYEFNELGKATKELTYNYINDEWVCNYMREKTYDEKGNPLKFLSYWVNDGVPALNYTTIYYYLPDPNEIENITPLTGASRHYSINGQMVTEGYRGIVITNGKKIIVK